MSTSASVLLNRLLARGKFRHAQVILKVAELGSLQRTAAAIGVSQSSVTQTLSYLERMLEVPLFERHARGMRPTVLCQELLPVARQMVSGLASGAEAVAARQQRGQHVVNVIASVAATHGLLVETLPRFADRCPDIAVHLREAEGDDQLLAIAQGGVDFVACRRPSVMPEGWNFCPLVDDRFAVVCHPQHPLAKRSLVSWLELAPERFVVAPTGVAARTRFDAITAKLPRPPRIHPLITRSPAMVRWLLRYEGVMGYLPFSYARPLVAVGELAEVQMEPQPGVEPLGLLHPERDLSEAAERLSAYLQERFRKNPGGEGNGDTDRAAA